MNRNVIIIGAGGHSRVIADIIDLSGDSVVGYLDDNVINDSVLGKTSDAHKFTDCEFIVGIGNNAVRERIMSENPDLPWYTAKHPSATVAKSARVGVGSVIAAGAVVGVCCTIGRGVIINTSASVDHDSTVGDFCHIAQGAHTGGAVRLGNCVWLGVGSIVANGMTLDNYSKTEVGEVIK